MDGRPGAHAVTEADINPLRVTAQVAVALGAFIVTAG